MKDTADELNTTAVATRPKGRPWPVVEFAAHFQVTPKHARYLMDSGRVEFIRIGKRRRMIPDHVVRKLEREGV